MKSRNVSTYKKNYILCNGRLKAMQILYITIFQRIIYKFFEVCELDISSCACVRACVHMIFINLCKQNSLLYFTVQASERRLRPLQKESTLRELLMESIKKPPKPLRSSGSRQNASKNEETSICKFFSVCR